MFTATSLRAARTLGRSLSNHGRDKYAFVARTASPTDCSRFAPNLRLRRTPRAHRRRGYRAPKQLRQSKPAVPTENNSDARKLPVATQNWHQRNQLLRPRRSFGRRSRRVSYLRDAGDYKHDRRTQPFLASQIDRRKSVAAGPYAMFQCAAVAAQ